MNITKSSLLSRQSSDTPSGGSIVPANVSNNHLYRLLENIVTSKENRISQLITFDYGLRSLRPTSETRLIKPVGEYICKKLEDCQKGEMVKLDKYKTGFSHSIWICRDDELSRLKTYESLMTVTRDELIDAIRNTNVVNYSLLKSLFLQSGNSYKVNIGKGGLSQVRMLRDMSTGETIVVRKVKTDIEANRYCTRVISWGNSDHRVEHLKYYSVRTNKSHITQIENIKKCPDKYSGVANSLEPDRFGIANFSITDVGQAINCYSSLLGVNKKEIIKMHKTISIAFLIGKDVESGKISEDQPIESLLSRYESVYQGCYAKYAAEYIHEEISIYFRDFMGFMVNGLISSLRSCHQAGIGHGDVAISNFLLTNLPQGKVGIKISDLDSCTSLNDKAFQYPYRPNFCPPDYKTKSYTVEQHDSYALGKTIHEVLELIREDCTCDSQDDLLDLIDDELAEPLMEWSIDISKTKSLNLEIDSLAPEIVSHLVHSSILFSIFRNVNLQAFRPKDFKLLYEKYIDRVDSMGVLLPYRRELYIDRKKIESKQTSKIETFPVYFRGRTVNFLSLEQAESFVKRSGGAYEKPEIRKICSGDIASARKPLEQTDFSSNREYSVQREGYVDHGKFFFSHETNQYELSHGKRTYSSGKILEGEFSYFNRAKLHTLKSGTETFGSTVRAGKFGEYSFYSSSRMSYICCLVSGNIKRYVDSRLVYSATGDFKFIKELQNTYPATNVFIEDDKYGKISGSQKYYSELGEMGIDSGKMVEKDGFIQEGDFQYSREGKRVVLYSGKMTTPDGGYSKGKYKYSPELDKVCLWKGSLFTPNGEPYIIDGTFTVGLCGNEYRCVLRTGSVIEKTSSGDNVSEGIWSYDESSKGQLWMGTVTMANGKVIKYKNGKRVNRWFGR